MPRGLDKQEKGQCVVVLTGSDRNTGKRTCGVQSVKKRVVVIAVGVFTLFIVLCMIAVVVTIWTKSARTEEQNAQLNTKFEDSYRLIKEQIELNAQLKKEINSLRGKVLYADEGRNRRRTCRNTCRTPKVSARLSIDRTSPLHGLHNYSQISALTTTDFIPWSRPSPRDLHGVSFYEGMLQIQRSGLYHVYSQVTHYGSNSPVWGISPEILMGHETVRRIGSCTSSKSVVLMESTTVQYLVYGKMLKYPKDTIYHAGDMWLKKGDCIGVRPKDLIRQARQMVFSSGLSFFGLRLLYI